MTRVLFVDDEPRVVAGLARMVRTRHDWEVRLAHNGTQALEAAASAPLDAIVSDVRMPGLDGVALLSEMRRLHPAVARIVLTGHTERGAALRSVGVAHQWLAKPCGLAELVGAVQAACALQSRLHNREVREALGRVGSLPSPPAVVLELNALVEKEDADLDQVARLISSEQAMTAKVLQLVNSAFFGLAQPMLSIRQALGYLGLDLVRELTVTTGVFATAEGACPLAGGFVERLRAHSNAVAMVAAELTGQGPLRQAAYMAGLLHDIGWLVLLAQSPSKLRQLVQARERLGLQGDAAEREVLGAGHADVGAYLLSLWGLPSVVVEAVAYHHDLPVTAAPGDGLAAVVHRADLLAQVDGSGLDVVEHLADHGVGRADHGAGRADHGAGRAD